MAGRRILIADAEAKSVEDVRQALGRDWTVVGAATGTAAQAELLKEACDVVIVDLDLPEINGAELLDHVRIKYPKTIRFLTARDAQKQSAMTHVAGGNQFLAKPFEKTALKPTIERCLSADRCIINNEMREMIGRIRAFPTIPSVYMEVVSALNNPNATTEEIGGIVAKDMAMTTQLLQMLNSAYFSLPQTITDPAEAVGLLGFETVKALVISVNLRSQDDKIKPIYFSIDNVWKHSTSVARVAKALALLETRDAGIASAAYTAGLLHDLGKIILAANFDSQYNGAHSIARKNHVRLCEVEKDIFGADHGQLAAYLFGLWGMPEAVIEAVAMHHNPTQSSGRSFSALTAIHVANALEHESNPQVDGLPNSVIDMDYLAGLGLDDRVVAWRSALGFAAVAETESTQSRPKPAPTQKASASAPLRNPPAPSWGWQQWVPTGLGIAAVLVIVGWLAATKLGQAPVQTSSAPIAQTSQPAAVPEPAPVPHVAAVVADPKPVVTSPPTAPAAAMTNTIASSAAPLPAKPISADDLAFQDVKLQGIIYSAGRPIAIINGKSAEVSEHVGKILVRDISPNSVTVEYHNQSKTLTLK